MKNINPLFPYFYTDEYCELNEHRLHLLNIVYRIRQKMYTH